MRYLIVFLSIFSLTVAASVHGSPFDEIESGELILLGKSGYQSAVRLKTNVVFDITGMVAHIKVKQRFQNTTNDFIEGVYVFPLPESAAVNHLEVLVGDRRIIGEIKERAQAKRIYEQARSEGKRASLVTQNRPNLFQNRVANIPPQGIVEVELTLIQPIDYQDGQFSVRFPLAITPRYIPGVPLNQKVSLQAGWGVPTTSVPDADLITPWQERASRYELEISGTVKSGMKLNSYGSSSHDIRFRLDQEELKFSLGTGQAPNRDFVMHWQPEPRVAPVAAYFTERVNNEDYGVLMLMPPVFSTQGQGDLPPQLLPREMTFVIDTSGSMGGISIDQAKHSLFYSLDQLSGHDTFNIVEFNSRMRPLFDEPKEVNQLNLLQARGFVAALTAGGGTEMLPALRFALAKPNSELLRQIVFITDGAVGNEAELFQLIQSKLGNARLFTVGIGSAPNGYFMRTAAEFGRGTYTFVNALHEVSTSMSSLFEKLSKPIARDIKVVWPEDWQVFPEYAVDLYAGEPVLIAVKEGREIDQIAVSGVTASRDWSQTLELNDSSKGSGIATLWARSKLKFLLDQKHQGVSEAEIRPKVLELALAHKILSPYTSFVALEQNMTRPLGSKLKTHGLPTPAPQGQTFQMTMPQTSTGWWRWMIVGLILIGFSFISVRFS